MARDAGHVLMSADYSQIELRIVAALSGDENMLEAFRRDADIHLETAARVFNVPVEQVTKDMRSHCKQVNFGIIYGISAFGLAQRLGIARGKATELINSYFAQYPGVKRYMDKAVEDAKRDGCARTMMGRRCPLPDINSRNQAVRSAAERVAINIPVQGAAADLMKLAMVRVSESIAANNLRSRLILQVHDELLFDARRDELDVLKNVVVESMTGVMKLDVPIKVDVGVGANWLDAH